MYICELLCGDTEQFYNAQPMYRSPKRDRMQYRVPGHAKSVTVLGKNVVSGYVLSYERGLAKRVCCRSEVSKVEAEYRSIFISNASGVMIVSAKTRLCWHMEMKKYGRKWGCVHNTSAKSM